VSGRVPVERARRLAEELVGPVANRHRMVLRDVDSDPRTVTLTWSGPDGEVDVVVDRVDGTVDTIVRVRAGGADRSLEELAAAAGDDDLVRSLAAAAAPGCELGARLGHHAHVLGRALDDTIPPPSRGDRST
jgi:hypothetical protein